MFCHVMIAALVLAQAGADGGRDSFSQCQREHMAVIERLQQEKLATEDRKTIVAERIERLKGSDDYLICRSPYGELLLPRTTGLPAEPEAKDRDGDK